MKHVAILRHEACYINMEDVVIFRPWYHYHLCWRFRLSLPLIKANIRTRLTLWFYSRIIRTEMKGLHTFHMATLVFTSLLFCLAGFKCAWCESLWLRCLVTLSYYQNVCTVTVTVFVFHQLCLKYKEWFKTCHWKEYYVSFYFLTELLDGGCM